MDTQTERPSQQNKKYSHNKAKQNTERERKRTSNSLLQKKHCRYETGRGKKIRGKKKEKEEEMNQNLEKVKRKTEIREKRKQKK